MSSAGMHTVHAANITCRCAAHTDVIMHNKCRPGMTQLAVAADRSASVVKLSSSSDTSKSRIKHGATAADAVASRTAEWRMGCQLGEAEAWSEHESIKCN